MSSKIQLRRDSAANWTATNPVLAQGEPGLETDTSKVKYGDGSTAWNLLDYASGGSGGGDFSTGFEDGMDESTYHFVTVQGKKEFTFESEGYKAFEVTLTAPMLVSFDADSLLTFTATDTPEIVNVWTDMNLGNSVYIYLKSDYESNYLNNFFNSLTNPSANTYEMNVSSPVPLSVGDKVVIRYWSEGTTYIGSSYDTYSAYIPDVNESAASNTVTISLSEYNDPFGGGPGSAYVDLIDPTYLSKHGIRFTQNDNSDSRNLTAVVDNQDGTMTFTFDGTAVQSKTTELVTFTYSAPDSRENDYYLIVPINAYPEILAGLKTAGDLQTPNTNKYSGNAYRSGYFTINGGSPIDFRWEWNRVNDQQLGMSVPGNVTYNQGDTIEFSFYKINTWLEIQVYRPNTSNWNNGYKWFDWKDDIATEYSSGQGNGIMAGNGQMLMTLYREAIGDWTPNKRMMPVQFAWSNNGNYQFDPYDPYRDNGVADWGYSTESCYPMYRFDERGVVFNCTQTWNDQSVTVKIRIIYKFNLIIADDNYDWFDC